MNAGNTALCNKRVNRTNLNIDRRHLCLMNVFNNLPVKTGVFGSVVLRWTVKQLHGPSPIAEPHIKRLEVVARRLSVQKAERSWMRLKSVNRCIRAVSPQRDGVVPPVCPHIHHQQLFLSCQDLLEKEGFAAYPVIFKIQNAKSPQA